MTNDLLLAADYDFLSILVASAWPLTPSTTPSYCNNGEACVSHREAVVSHQPTIIHHHPVPPIHCPPGVPQRSILGPLLNCFFKLNSEFILIGSRKSHIDKPHHFCLTINNTTVTASPHVKNVGVLLDSTLSFENHINKTQQLSFFHLKNLSTSLLFLFTHPFPSGWTTLLFYFIGLLSNLLNRLRLCPEPSCPPAHTPPTRQHITPVLQDLHWLPVQQRI